MLEDKMNEKLPKCGKIHESMYQKSSTNPKKDKYNEIQIEKHHHQMSRAKRGESLETTRAR
jgi:hypothetical protein